jgi:hypothetical protein
MEIDASQRDRAADVGLLDTDEVVSDPWVSQRDRVPSARGAAGLCQGQYPDPSASHSTSQWQPPVATALYVSATTDRVTALNGMEMGR